MTTEDKNKPIYRCDICGRPLPRPTYDHLCDNCRMLLVLSKRGGRK